ncbi:hypothetical protein ACFY5C_27525 [Streptomyces sp. NPDC012935]|uniref:hypothetical protein n=1 Tax=Streptomyces sp. NPDC012935 TaxID=3364857 RepID=UPI0036B6B3EA
MLVAPEKLTRHGLEAVITSADGLKGVAEAATRKEALPRAQATRPSVIVIELLAHDDLRTMSALHTAVPGCALLTIIAADALPQAPIRTSSPAESQPVCPRTPTPAGYVMPSGNVPTARPC